MEISRHKTLHFIGIGGSGMSAIARVLVEMGYKVSGSDLKENSNTIRLRDMGAKIFLRQDSRNLREADVVVVSTAIPEDNAEYAYAKQEKLTILRRAEMLNFLMVQFKQRIAVAGTHGKTTTTSMIARLLVSLQQHPTYVIGGELTDYGSNASFGDSPYFVAEADESDGSFLMLHPTIAVLTNIEAEHMEHYKSFDKLKEAFRQFMQGVLDRNGYLILNKDDVVLSELSVNFPEDKVSYYSLDTSSDLMAKDIVHTPQGVRYTVVLEGKVQGEVLLQVFGRHNVYNSLAVIALGLREGFFLEEIKTGLNIFCGAKRRFQFIGEHADIQIYDDYGHHPTEIMATLAAAKSSLGRRVVCVFQPHRYSRTRDLLEEFPVSFLDADLVVITEIYSANEKKINELSGKLIIDKMQASEQKKAFFVPRKSDVVPELLPKLLPGDVVFTMGAGDIYTVGKELLMQLKTRDKLF
ncbi:MAG: UDP-N-acetylmuramate--L-alanine ligase [Candidatus Margulisbacteria bacterium]|nr:UDP-N-acetylmuramate--L-alanine ligase [Candidatus Margulisiibacteriota bacterium]